MNVYSEIQNFDLLFIRLRTDLRNRSFATKRTKTFVLPINEVCKKVQNTFRNYIKYLEVCNFCVNTHTHTHILTARIIQIIS